MGQIKIRVILLDVMETLVTEPFWHALPSYFGTTRDELQSRIHPTSWIEFEKGTITEEEYLATFFRDGRPVDAAPLHRCLLQAFEWLDGMQPLLAELRSAGYPMYALSNYPAWYELIEQKLELSRYLDWSFVSCRTGIRKPHPRAYLQVTENLHVAPGDCLFVDDRRVNIEAARTLGMQAILKQDAQQLREHFVDLKLLRE